MFGRDRMFLDIDILANQDLAIDYMAIVSISNLDIPKILEQDREGNETIHSMNYDSATQLSRSVVVLLKCWENQFRRHD